MRPTRFGLQSAAFYAAMVAVHFVSPYDNLSFLLLAFLTLAGLLGLWWTLRNLGGVEASVAELEPFVAGVSSRPATARAELRAPRRRRFGLRVELELEGGARVVGRAPVLAGAAAVPLELPALPRGLHRVVRARVVSSYPLGLAQGRRAVAAPTELAAYPAPGIETAARTGADVLAEVLGGPAEQGELQPAGLRDYAAGDELRRVHWRATARRGQPVVCEWEGAGGGGLELSIDRRCSPDELERALGVASAVVHLAREQKESLALSSQGLQETFGDGHRPWSEALRFLAGAQVLAPEGPEPPPVSPSVARLPARSDRGRAAHAAQAAGGARA